MLALFLLASCGTQTEASRQPAKDPATDTASAQPPTPPTPDAVPPSGERVKESEADGRWSFEYAWPKEVSAIPALAERFTEEREEARRELRADYEKAVAEAPEDCVSCRSRGYGKTWAVVAETPAFLSLSAEMYSYTGGAHGGSNFDSLLWDKSADVPRETMDLFRSKAALDGAVRDVFCTAVDKERARRRGGPIERSDDWSRDCLKPSEAGTLILGSRDGRSFDRIGFLLAPYTAGSYAEGSYDITLPVTRAVREAVKPEYRGAFAVAN